MTVELHEPTATSKIRRSEDPKAELKTGINAGGRAALRAVGGVTVKLPVGTREFE